MNASWLISSATAAFPTMLTARPNTRDWKRRTNAVAALESPAARPGDKCFI